MRPYKLDPLTVRNLTKPGSVRRRRQALADRRPERCRTIWAIPLVEVCTAIFGFPLRPVEAQLARRRPTKRRRPRSELALLTYLDQVNQGGGRKRGCWGPPAWAYYSAAPPPAGNALGAASEPWRVEHPPTHPPHFRRLGPVFCGWGPFGSHREANARTSAAASAPAALEHPLRPSEGCTCL
jgi:hypothetical protein